MTTDFQHGRISLGARLRELRTEAQLTVRQLAALCEWAPSKISKLENGKQTATTTDLDAWAAGVGRPESAAEPKGRLAGLESTYRSWRRQLTGGHRAGASLTYADSNAWAAHLWSSDLGAQASAWNSVHLYDAHHDAGYRTNHNSFDAWKESGDGIRCENWMLADACAGSELRVHFPPWRESLVRPPASDLARYEALGIPAPRPPMTVTGLDLTVITGLVALEITATLAVLAFFHRRVIKEGSTEA